MIQFFGGQSDDFNVPLSDLAITILFNRFEDGLFKFVGTRPPVKTTPAMPRHRVCWAPWQSTSLTEMRWRRVSRSIRPYLTFRLSLSDVLQGRWSTTSITSTCMAPLILSRSIACFQFILQRDEEGDRIGIDDTPLQRTVGCRFPGRGLHRTPVCQRVWLRLRTGCGVCARQVPLLTGQIARCVPAASMASPT